MTIGQKHDFESAWTEDGHGSGGDPAKLQV